MHVDNSSAVLPRTSIQRWVWGAFALLFVAIVVSAVVFAPFPVQAGVKEAIAEFISWVLSAIVSVLGKLLLVAVYLLTLIAQYNDFVNAAAVVNGWVIVRDVGNMFFIIVLLIIAFATILNIPNYQWKALLPKLVIAAILINFSKTIAGLLIDFSQVIMLTFVNGFAAAAGGNFAQMYKIRELVSLNPGYEGNVDLLAILGGYFLAFVMLAIALTTTLIMAVILAFRIVMLWALVVLSPLPYVLNLLPQGKKYGDKWWSMFGEYLTVGPVLAFFLWLALVSVGSGEVSGFTGTGGAGASTAELAEYEKSTSAIATDAGKPTSLLSFVISISMLIAGLKITGEMGVIGAGAAKGALGKMEGMAKWGAKKFTGYRYASERVGAAWKMHENARQEKVQAGGAKLYGGVGTVLATPGRIFDKLKEKIPEETRAKFAPLQAKAAAARKEASDLRAKGDFDGAKKAEARARRWERGSAAAGYAWKAGMVAAAPVTGGASLLGLVPAAVRQAQKAGGEAETAGKDYKFKAVKTALDAMKDMKPDEVRKQLNNPTASNAERQAAFLKATQEGLLDPNEVAGGESFLESLGADKKTISTFRSYAEKGSYAGTMLKGGERDADGRTERQRRVRDGRMPTKDLNPKEFSGDGGSLAADFVLHGNDAQRKELGQSRALKDAYKQGVLAAFKAEKAKGASADPVALDKLGEEMLRAGAKEKDASGREMSALETARSYGLDDAQLAKALQGTESSGVLANITPADLTADPGLLPVIASNISAARFRSAKGAATKGDDPANAVNVAAIEAAIKGSKEYMTFERGQSAVRGATSRTSSVRKSFDTKSAELARTPPTDPGYAAIEADADRLEKDLNKAEKDLKDAKTAFEAAMQAAGVTDSERGLYEGMQTKRK